MDAYNTNFYFTGGTLRLGAPSYVYRQADDDLYKALKASKFCYVLTSRQMGKSSLMVRTTVRLREEGLIKVVILDLQGIGQNITLEQWYFGLLSKIGSQLNLSKELENFWTSADIKTSGLGPLQRWMEALKQVILKATKEPCVIFIDEIDYVRSLNFSTDEFFAGIRECYTGRSENADLGRLTFCLLGVATPSDLIRNVHTTPFNIGDRIELDDFTNSEASPLADGLGKDAVTSKVVLDRIIFWTNGHPYLTQKLCQAAAKNINVVDVATVDSLCNQLFLSSKGKQQDDNLIFVRDRILKDKSPKEIDNLLDLYDKSLAGKNVRSEDKNPNVATLQLSGITRSENGYLRIRNNIYANIFDSKWIKANRSDAESQRRKEAYRKGLYKSATVFTLIITLLGFFFIVYREEQIQRLKAQERALHLQHEKLSAQEQVELQNKRLKRLSDSLNKANDDLKISLQENSAATALIKRRSGT